ESLGQRELPSLAPERSRRHAERSHEGRGCRPRERGDLDGSDKGQTERGGLAGGVCLGSGGWIRQ
ncbi:unnamed protein product, partial [Symbiodinium sp. KB8]